MNIAKTIERQTWTIAIVAAVVAAVLPTLVDATFSAMPLLA